jgi:formate--tetrahydrofolate ligase
MKDWIKIAQQAKILPINKIAEKIGLKESEIEQYGKYKAKVSLNVLEKLKNNGKLILFTAMTPTKAGEGKTTCSIGLAQSLTRLKKKAMVCLREPSMGPVFGIKGGGTGSGHSQVLPMEDINLSFTGDIYAVEAANNLLAAVIDNYLSQNNKLKIDPKKITWKRTLDVNDRSLRKVHICAEGNRCIPRDDMFSITAASEIMAILCLSENINDLKKRLEKIIIGYNTSGEPVTVKQLNIQGAMTVILKDAIRPNLVQTIENVPAFVHGGPFANIAHGTSSIIATRMALGLSDYVVTEAGFGADLGCEKFMNIVCRIAGFRPNTVVIVATVKALRMHGNSEDYKEKNLKAVKKGFCNLEKQIENVSKFGIPATVAINKFEGDSEEELNLIIEKCKKIGINAYVVEFYKKGGLGGLELANEVIRLCEKKSNLKFLYDLNLPIKKKLEIISKEMYGASGVVYSEKAEKDIARLEKIGFKNLPICVSKTQSSLTDNPKILGRPKDFQIHIREVSVSAGAGFIIAFSGKLITMPGLPKFPNALNIDITDEGKVTGLF